MKIKKYVYLRSMIWRFDVHMHCEIINMFKLINVPITSVPTFFVYVWWESWNALLVNYTSNLVNYTITNPQGSVGKYSHIAVH